MSVRSLLKHALSTCLCCFLLTISIIYSANAAVCFLPEGGNCSTGGDRNPPPIPCDTDCIYNSDKGEGWDCTQCSCTAGRWKCEKSACPDEYSTDAQCNSGQSKVCEGKSGSAQCCKCEDNSTRCQHEGYAYKKTANNKCRNQCPYDSNYYEECWCENKYDLETTEKCYAYETCEVGDLANTKKYQKTNDLHKNCAQKGYVTKDSPQYTSDDYTCGATPICTECDDVEYYQCTPKISCNASEGKYETEELCVTAYRSSTQHASVLDWFEKVINDFSLIPTCYAAVTDPELSEEACAHCRYASNYQSCMDACNPQTKVDGPLCPINQDKNCVACTGSCDRQGYPCCARDLGTVCIGMAMEHDKDCVYCKTDDPTWRAEGCEGYPCCDITPTIQCRIDPDKNCALCTNGCDRKEYPCCLNNPEIVDPDPDVTESPCELKDGCWVVKTSEEKPCNATNYPYVKASGGGATAFGGVNWDDNTIISYLNSIGSIYAAHTDHLEGDFDNEIFNKIADDANECTDENGVKRYDKICSGRPESKCTVSETRQFIPNGCTSSTYIAHYNGRRYYKPSGATWGECETVCSSLGSQYYNTYADCLAQTGKAQCFSENSCWRSCESAGYYSTEADCSGGKAGACIKQGSCYVKNTFYIRLKPGQTLSKNISCPYGGASVTASWWASIAEGQYLSIPKDINGIQNGDITNSKREFKAGTYYLCVGISSGTCSGGSRSWGIRRIQAVGYLPGANGEPSYGYTPGGSYCFADTLSGNSYAYGCDQTEKYGPSYSCHSYEFKPGFIYEVAATADW